MAKMWPHCPLLSFPSMHAALKVTIYLSFSVENRLKASSKLCGTYLVGIPFDQTKNLYLLWNWLKKLEGLVKGNCARTTLWIWCYGQFWHFFVLFIWALRNVAGIALHWSRGRRSHYKIKWATILSSDI